MKDCYISFSITRASGGKTSTESCPLPIRKRRIKNILHQLIANRPNRSLLHRRKILIGCIVVKEGEIALPDLFLSTVVEIFDGQGDGQAVNGGGLPYPGRFRSDAKIDQCAPQLNVRVFVGVFEGGLESYLVLERFRQLNGQVG